MTTKQILTTTGVLALPFLTSGQVTFSKDIAPIIYNQCSVCHRPGEIGPMALTNYQEVRNWAPTIKYVTSIRYMPPWKPDPEYSRFIGENFLTDEQIGTIAEWVDNGTPRGDPASEPLLPEFPEGSVLGTPDLVLSFAQSHLHKGDNKDEYRYFVLPTGLTEDRMVKAVELRPGNAKIVHHALFFEDATGQAAMQDAMTPEYGFDGFGGFTGGSQEEILTQKQYPGYVPGQKPRYYPDGLGQVMQAGSDLVIQMHYAPWPNDERDSSTVNIFFADANEVVDREVAAHIMVPFPDVINDYFIIAPNAVETFHGRWTVPEDLSFMGLAPHMHLLGQHWEVYLEHTDGSIDPLIHIPEWDFNWQGTFYFERFVVAEKDAVIHAIASYDNTTENPNNPNDPPIFVTWGEGTEDEMYYLPLLYVPYNQGDEDVVFGETTNTNDTNHATDRNVIFDIYPNPVEHYVNAAFMIDRGQPLKIEIIAMDGTVVRSLRQNEFFRVGDHIINFKTTELNHGVYMLSVKGLDFAMTKKFIKL